MTHPALEPAYDDDRAEAAPPGTGHRVALQAVTTDTPIAAWETLPLPLDLPPRAAPAHVSPGDVRRPKLRVVSDPEETAEAEALAFAPQATSRQLLPDPAPLARVLVRAVLEAMAGDRPVSQLSPHLTPSVLDAVERRSHLRSSRPWAASVRSVHVSEPGDGVAELCALVQRDDRCLAVAGRMEGLDGRWRISAFEFVT